MIALNLLFGVPLIYAAVFGALDVIILLAMTGKRFRIIEQDFVLLIAILVVGILYNLVVVGPSLSEIGYHSIVPLAQNDTALLIVVGIIGATVMPHACDVHSWLSKNKMDLLGRNIPGTTAKSEGSLGATITDSVSRTAPHQTFTTEERVRTNKVHRVETIILLTIAGIVNAGILLVAIPLYPNADITINVFVSGMDQYFGPAVGTLFLLTLLASGLSSSAFRDDRWTGHNGGYDGIACHLWVRRIVTRGINVFPTTIVILLGLPLLSLLVYSQVILSLMIPLPMIPLVYYTSKKKFMGVLANKRITIILALITVATNLGVQQLPVHLHLGQRPLDLRYLKVDYSWGLLGASTPVCFVRWIRNHSVEGLLMVQS